MADGRHLEFRFSAVIWASSNILHQIWYADGKANGLMRPTGQKSNFGKSKMADGRHLEFRLWVIFGRRSKYLV